MMDILPYAGRNRDVSIVHALSMREWPVDENLVQGWIRTILQGCWKWRPETRPTIVWCKDIIRESVVTSPISTTSPYALPSPSQRHSKSSVANSLLPEGAWLGAATVPPAHTATAASIRSTPSSSSGWISEIHREVRAMKVGSGKDPEEDDPDGDEIDLYDGDHEKGDGQVSDTNSSSRLRIGPGGRADS